MLKYILLIYKNGTRTVECTKSPVEGLTKYCHSAWNHSEVHWNVYYVGRLVQITVISYKFLMWFC